MKKYTSSKIWGNFFKAGVHFKKQVLNKIMPAIT